MQTKDIFGLLAILVIAGLLLAILQPTTLTKAKQFSSYAELTEFIKTRSEAAPYYGVMAARGEMMPVSAPMTQAAGVEAKATEYAAEYSTTNIQVAGVDEPDIVKTDGKYIYTVSQDKLFIIDAYPAETVSISSQINFTDGISNIFVNKDRLIVFGGGWDNSVIYVYDISDHADPKIVRNISVNGSYYDARMIGDYVYAIANQPVQILDSGPILPVMTVGAQTKTIEATQITYFDTYDTSFVYTYVTALNTQDDAEEPNEKVFLLGYSQNLYVSPENIYTVYTKQLSYTEYYDRMINEAILPNIPSDLANQVSEIWNSQNDTYEKMSAIGSLINNYAESLGPEEGAAFMREIENKTEEVIIELEKEREKTVIHKISVSGADIEYKTSGEVPGHVLNQFSMDEWDGNFRIATTTGQSWRETSLNHIYVLDGNLQTIGKLENLARTEQIFSARFIGDRAYLVTFRRTDPLFVIDLSNPSAPAVLGELKIPGWSDYLHPYDADHLIGLGEQADENGRRTGQIKLSLFDVSDVAHPSELSTYLIGESGDWAYSEALNDHKAFLFSKSKNLLVIPVSINNWRHENKYFQGAYVFDLTLENGFKLKGNVTHAISNASEEEQYYDYQSAVRRALYMDNTLYTVSDQFVKANSLVDLSEIAEVKLPIEQSRMIRGMVTDLA